MHSISSERGVDYIEERASVATSVRRSDLLPNMPAVDRPYFVICFGTGAPASARVVVLYCAFRPHRYYILCSLSTLDFWTGVWNGLCT